MRNGQLFDNISNEKAELLRKYYQLLQPFALENLGVKFPQLPEALILKFSNVSSTSKKDEIWRQDLGVKSVLPEAQISKFSNISSTVIWPSSFRSELPFEKWYIVGYWNTMMIPATRHRPWHSDDYNLRALRCQTPPPGVSRVYREYHYDHIPVRVKDEVLQLAFGTSECGLPRFYSHAYWVS